ncbi:DUF4158 domain-containing protein [Streptomyces sp. NPDC001970]
MLILDILDLSDQTPCVIGFIAFYTQYGRFPRARAELSGEVVEFVARQVQVSASELDCYEWTGRTVECHRAQIRGHLGFRECSVADAEKLTPIWPSTSRARNAGPSGCGWSCCYVAAPKAVSRPLRVGATGSSRPGVCGRGD